MARKYLIHPVIFIFLIAGISCNTSYQPQTVQYQSYQVSSKQREDSVLLTMLKPYSEKVNRTMNDVIGVAATTLEKTQPESTLGNFLADAFLAMAAEKYSVQPDIAILNYGGMRLTQLPAGNITNGKIFELMPFDNLLLLQKLKGNVLQQLLDLIAAKGGWPVAGVTMQIKDKKAVNVLIGGNPIDMNKVYTLVNSDFIANGGENAEMLRSIPQIINGYLMRDAIFDYIKKLASQGKPVTASIEKRITNAE